MADMSDNEMALLAPNSRLFDLALQAAGRLTDPELAEQTRQWLRKAKELRQRRHEVVHSIVLHSHNADLAAYHPSSGNVLTYSTREVTDLAVQVARHADEGNYMCIFRWPPALGLDDSAQADGNDPPLDDD